MATDITADTIAVENSNGAGSVRNRKRLTRTRLTPSGDRAQASDGLFGGRHVAGDRCY